MALRKLEHEDEIAAKLKEAEELRANAAADVAAELQEKAEKAREKQRAAQLSLGFKIDPEIDTTFRGSVKLSGIPELTDHEDVRFEGVGHLTEFRIKDKDGVWRLQQVIVPVNVEVSDMNGKPIKKKKFKEDKA